MLIAMCALVSALASAGLCWGVGAFLSLQWLYLLPLCFVGGMVLCAAIVFLIAYIMSKRVDMAILPEDDSPAYRTVAHWIVGALKTITRLRLVVTGMEKLPKEGRFLLVCNHTADTDPVIMLHCFRKSRLAFISKRENDTRFIVGPFMRKMLCQPINRENDREALKTILRCVEILKQDKASVAVFPEGYESLDGKLRRFRSGVFKIAQKANVPVVVCTLHNARPAMKKMLKLQKSTVELRLLQVISAEKCKAMTTVALGDKVYEMMAADLGPENVYDYSQEA